MSKGKSETVAKALLKSLCCGNGWSYAVFWGFNQQNSLFLTLRDAYYEEEMGGLIDDMLLQVNILGSGVVGQVAFTKNHKWMLSDTNSVWQSHHGLADNCDELLQDDSEFYGQFSCGIKTIAVISVEPLGVVQFGSNQKLPERMEFVDETKKLFQGTDIETIFAQSSSSSANGDVFGLSGSLASSICNSSYFMSPEALPSPDFVDPIMNMVQSFPVEAFSLFDDQFQNGGVETQTNFSSYGFQPSCSSVWGLEGSSLTSLQGNILPGAISQDCDNAFCALPDQFEYCTNTVQNVLERPVMTSTHELGQSAFDEVLDGFGCKMPEKSDNIRKPAATSGQQWDFGTSISGCTSEHSIGSKDWPSNRLFSKLGLDHLLSDNPSSSCSFVGSSCNDQLSSTKKRRIEHPLASEREVTKLETIVSLIGENCSTNVMNTKDHEKPSKAVKKKAKPGTRPIPKDRVRTYERLAELRELIPNGGKMSIDRLLHQTIKQLLFLQSVTRLAEGLKKTEELKDKKGRKDSNSNSNTNGVTWACEIENQTMICPLVVEDLCTPGQMLIEILCQEQGFFLEIVDVIRGFGLNILKGTMELRETKIWAHFIVEPEANAFVSRHELFSSLLQLLQLSGPSELHARDQLGNVRDNGRPSTSSNCSESAVPFPISLPEGLY
ncbi:PREDICTED: transcription factor bHLH157-like isoform X2 [Ipomoea nil]|uniref:transcription factor bHLH157-like isoform X2 n=1 Tax=Ipomoea nil TaxID=35883 RepID=UPI000900BBA7|nr:PREDICTED: transcription factor bHLH157-like isoform X2 [Ipomoea nil]